MYNSSNRRFNSSLPAKESDVLVKNINSNNNYIVNVINKGFI